MKKFIKTIKDIFSIEELRGRIITTVLLLLVFRLGAHIQLPGIDPTLNLEFSDVRGMIDQFLGGAFSRASIFALGIMPYITASIVIQLLTVAVPKFQKMQKEGESGRKRMTQITRLLTIVVGIVQSSAYLATTIPPDAILINPAFFNISSIILLTAGIMFCMWLGERITEKGIGNGISMLIMIGIISRLPQAIVFEAADKNMQGALFFVLELVALFFIVIAVILVTQATRRIPVQYAKQVVGNKVYGGQRQFIPLKLNAAGVMPIIFAQSLMFLPAMMAGLFSDSEDIAAVVGAFSDISSLPYNVLFAILIIVFTFFYTAITINPREISDNMKRNGGFIPGVQPGEPTSEYIDNVLSKITLPGSIFLAMIAVIPAFAMILGINNEFAQFYGGTSLLIMVGVILDTLQQIESYLLLRHYDGLMKTGKMSDSNIAVA